MENHEITYTGIKKDWSLIIDLTSINIPNIKDVVYFIIHEFDRYSNSGATKYYKHTIINSFGTVT
jgi:hypothetical protein